MPISLTDVWFVLLPGSGRRSGGAFGFGASVKTVEAIMAVESGGTLPSPDTPPHQAGGRIDTSVAERWRKYPSAPRPAECSPSAAGEARMHFGPAGSFHSYSPIIDVPVWLFFIIFWKQCFDLNSFDWVIFPSTEIEFQDGWGNVNVTWNSRRSWPLELVYVTFKTQYLGNSSWGLVDNKSILLKTPIQTSKTNQDS